MKSIIYINKLTLIEMFASGSPRECPRVALEKNEDGLEEEEEREEENDIQRDRKRRGL